MASAKAALCSLFLLLPLLDLKMRRADKHNKPFRITLITEYIT